MADLRPIDAPFVALGPSGVAIRDRLGASPARMRRFCGWSVTISASLSGRISRPVARAASTTTPTPGPSGNVP